MAPFYSDQHFIDQPWKHFADLSQVSINVAEKTFAHMIFDFEQSQNRHALIGWSSGNEIKVLLIVFMKSACTLSDIQGDATCRPTELVFEAKANILIGKHFA